MRSTFLVTISAGVLLAATVGATAPQPLSSAVRPTAQELTLAPGDAHLQKLFGWADSAPGANKALFTAAAADFPAASETSIDAGPAAAPGPANAPCTPVISKISGKFSSYDGDILINGSCFGPYAAGKLVISGFPTGNPQLSIVSWTSTVISANFPTITGVPDLTMHVQVTSGALASKPVDAKFVASWGDPIALPSKYIVNKTCEQLGACSSAPHAPTGTHWSVDSTMNVGTDVWAVNLPDHFHLYAINIAVLKGQLAPGNPGAPLNASTSNATGSGSSETFSVNWLTNGAGPQTMQTIQYPTYGCNVDWGALIVGVVLEDPTELADAVESSGCSGGYGLKTELLPTYDQAYRVEVLVRGPAGMKPG